MCVCVHVWIVHGVLGDITDIDILLLSTHPPSPEHKNKRIQKLMITGDPLMKFGTQRSGNG